MMDENINRDKKQPTYEVVVALPLKKLGIGNPEGIPSAYADLGDEELAERIELIKSHLVTPTDLSCTACIDGRCTLHNADGSDAQIRLRRVGGSASNLGVAMNSGAKILDQINAEEGFGQLITEVDEYIATETGFGRSAHLGGCGGANGEIGDNVAIAENDAIMAGVETLMELPAAKSYLDVGFDETLGNDVRRRAAKTAEFLQIQGWDGQAYVDGVVTSNPENVEDLEVDHEDEKFHGHKENSLVIIIGDETLDMNDEFVWNLKASKMIAEALANSAGEPGSDDYQRAYTQALIAEIAKHIAVADRLPSDSTPVIILQSDAVA